MSQSSWNWRKRLLLAVAFTIAQILIVHPTADMGNQEVYIPLIRYLEGSATFGSDPIANDFGSYSIFFNVLAAFQIPDHWLLSVLIIAYILFQIAIFYSLLLLWKLIVGDYKYAIFAGIIFAGNYLPVLGAACWYGTFTHQQPGILCAILAIYFLLQSKTLISAVMLGIGMNFHGMFIVPAVFFCGIYLIFQRKYWQTILYGLIIFVISTPVLTMILSSNIFEPPDFFKLWLNVIRIRSAPEMFPSALGSLWLPFISFFIIGIIAIKKYFNSTKKWFIPLLISVGFLCLVSAFFSEIVVIPSIIRLQLFRSTVYIAIMFMPFVVRWVFENINSPAQAVMSIGIFGAQPNLIQFGLLGLLVKRKLWQYVIAGLVIMLFLLSIPTIFLRLDSDSLLKSITYIDYKLLLKYGLWGISGIFLVLTKNKKFLLPALLVIGIARAAIGGIFRVQNDDWVQIQYKAKEITTKSEIFLVPPMEPGFRVYSQRGVVFDWKSGCVAIYNPEFSIVWNERLWNYLPNNATAKQAKPKNLERYYNKLSIGQKIKLARKYDASYIVCETIKDCSVAPAATSGKWSIYKVSEP